MSKDITKWKIHISSYRSIEGDCTWDAGHDKASQERKVRKVCKDSIISFVKESEQHKTSSRKYNKSGILHETEDLVIEADIDQQLRFPEAICISTLRPDIVIYSLKLRKIILIEWKNIPFWGFIKGLN